MYVPACKEQAWCGNQQPTGGGLLAAGIVLVSQQSPERAARHVCTPVCRQAWCFSNNQRGLLHCTPLCSQQPTREGSWHACIPVSRAGSGAASTGEGLLIITPRSCTPAL
jgi:hypothetical protein